MTFYEKYLCTPEKAARFIIDTCGCDCYQCPFTPDCCYRKFGLDNTPENIAMVLNWLNTEEEEIL